MAEIDEIRQQMALIRHNMHQDVTAAVGPAGRMFDWRMYIRQAPWIAVGLSFAAGYLLVPWKVRPAPPLSIEGLSLYRDDPPPSRPTSRGFSVWSLARWGLGFAAPLAMQAAQAYAASFIENLLLNQRGVGPVPFGDPTGPVGPSDVTDPIDGSATVPPWVRNAENDHGNRSRRFE